MTVSESISISAELSPEISEEASASESTSVATSVSPQVSDEAVSFESLSFSKSFSTAIFSFVKKSAFDIGIDSGVFDGQTIDLSDQPIGPGAFLLGNGGSNLYHLDRSENIQQFVLEEPWEIGTAELDKQVDFSDLNDEARGLWIRPNGETLYIADNNESFGTLIFQYELSTPWDVSTATFEASSRDLSSSGGFPNQVIDDIQFKPDGKKIFVESEVLRTLTLDTAWDVTTINAYSGKKFDEVENAFHFTNGGDNLFVARDNGYQSDAFINGFSASNSWNIESLSLDALDLNVTEQTTLPKDVFFGDEGNRMYVLGSDDGGNVAFYQYSFVERAVDDSISISSTVSPSDIQTFTDPFESISISASTAPSVSESAAASENASVSSTTSPVVSQVSEIQGANVSILAETTPSIQESGLQLNESISIESVVSVSSPDSTFAGESLTFASTSTMNVAEDEAVVNESISINS